MRLWNGCGTADCHIFLLGLVDVFAPDSVRKYADTESLVEDQEVVLGAQVDNGGNTILFD